MKQTAQQPALELEPSPDSPPASPAPGALAPAVQATQLSPLSILDKAISGGVTRENIEVVKDLMAMAREQRAEEAKAAFARAFFKLRQNMPELHADKQALNRAGEVTFTYCSESEIAKMLEPHLMNYGFAMLFGQKEDNGRITVEVTLMHEGGHTETRGYTVRAGTPNAMKDAAMCDAGGATTAWRQLMIKWFGLKSRIQENQDIKNEGEKISPDKVQTLREMLTDTGSDVARFLALAGADSLETINEAVYPVLIRALSAKQKR